LEPPLRPSVRPSLIACLPLLAALSLGACDKAKPSNEQGAGNMATAEVSPPAPTNPPLPVGSKLDRSHKGDAMPAMPFAAPGGAPATLGSFRGHPVLVNFWATWCAPCVKELPTLDALAARETGKMAVVAIGMDMGGDAQVQPFWKSHGLTALTAYTDAKNGLLTATGAAELPTTILYDSKGKEVWRASGGMDWTGPDAAKLLAETQ
jgi:thiol-disulfide isomerase/thioredoxin